MRGLMRNKRAVTYKNYVSTAFEEDSNHVKTGNKIVTYSDPKLMYCTVSAPTGNAVLEMFGTNENYDKIVACDKRDVDINENSILWIDTQYASDIPHDYIVRKVIRHRNFLFVGVRKVDVK